MKNVSWTFAALFTLVPLAQAKLNVITTITDLRSIASEVGGEHVAVESLGRGTQDPHFIEAKPSYMMKVSKADLVVSIGLELESAWLDGIIQGARNPRVNPGSKGNLEVGPLVAPLEVPSGRVTRADGDVHPGGNPHILLDPIRAGEVAIAIGKKLAELDPVHAKDFSANAITLQSRLVEKTKGWQARVAKTGIKQVITYHKTLTYFLNRFNIGNPAILEPKPGIPPTSKHIMQTLRLIRAEKINLVLIENYFDPTVTVKMKQEYPALRSVTVPVSVEGASGIHRLDDLYEALVSAVEGKG